jgi:hypothetical protein
VVEGLAFLFQSRGDTEMENEMKELREEKILDDACWERYHATAEGCVKMDLADRKDPHVADDGARGERYV